MRTVSISGGENYKKVKNIYFTPGVQTILCWNFFEEIPAGRLNLYIPASVDGISKRLVRTSLKNVTFIVEEGSYAEEYARQAAEKYGCQYRVVDQIEYPE